MNSSLAEENKAKLLAEQKKLQSMLAADTRPDSETPGGHIPKYSEEGSEEGENASEVETFGNNLSVAADLEKRLAEVEMALQKISDGTYGICVIGGEPIDEARLRAQPSAVVCVAHSK